jgi:hypothetical protein
MDVVLVEMMVALMVLLTVVMLAGLTVEMKVVM